MRRHTAFPASILLLLFGPAAEAQTPADIRPGARVRIEQVSHDKNKTFTGTLVSQTLDAVQLRLDRSKEVVTIPLAQAVRFEVSREQKSGAGRGALTGLLVGALAGAALGAGCDCGEPGLAALVFGGMLGGLGTALGAGVGAAARVDQWEPVSLPGREAAQQGSGGSGTLFQLQLSF